MSCMIRVSRGIAQALLLPDLVAGPLALILILFVLALRVSRENFILREESINAGFVSLRHEDGLQ